MRELFDQMLKSYLSDDYCVPIAHILKAEVRPPLISAVLMKRFRLMVTDKCTRATRIDAHRSTLSRSRARLERRTSCRLC